MGGADKGVALVSGDEETPLRGAGQAVGVVVAHDKDDDHAPTGAGPAPAGTRAGLADAMVEDEMRTHLTELMAAAVNHPNAAGVPCRSVLNGYNESAEFVRFRLTEGGFADTDIRTFPVEAPVYTQIAVPSLVLDGIELIYGSDFAGVRYSGGNGAQTVNDAPLVVIPSADACNATAYPSTPGAVFVTYSVAGGSCDYASRVMAAEAAGAAAVLLSSSPGSRSLPGSRARPSPWYPGSWLASVPIIGVTDTVYQLIAAKGAAARVTIATNTETVVADTYDVCADVPPPPGVTPSGAIIVMGAHLDSVAEGPGINDDGSGSAVVLQLALAYRKQAAAIRSPHTLRFCWWAAEELGLIGSYQYVAQLQANEPADWDAIELYLNYDMLASPNYVRFVHQANDSIATGTVLRRAEAIEAAYLDAFAAEGLTYELSSMRAGSDFLPFLIADKPTGGLLTGAGGLKTMEQRTIFGGFADAPYDPCYHSPCDTLENIAYDALVQNARVAARVAVRFAQADPLWPSESK
ncbi:lipoprotein aminopeptidase lpqL [Thecamonas trahens ATCC 50062]|uniref:Lipoprotein aminopeptidase lpqL n=1 Tax=Thecamonas trahens ATCC 50062 TaxID=461836 RepID=A0A0L0DAR0_THETB|nr:lipoprotein aminopeptidase lpqL [Thecamonas trahens ATCC 50062]KNC49427.1 lipoprotein aminopeptidase lpqL [Thecamonas trahens ATCC 50062]|eukprot:XP_013757850.1 lipoprotein aminopeptidase lpqL [Thecamonas trahens ATCC 50062]